MAIDPVNVGTELLNGTDGDNWRASMLKLNANVADLDGREPLDGQDGVGLPAGGTAFQIPEKIDGTDYNTRWATPRDRLIEKVSGEAGFVNVSGAVTMDVSDARAFHQQLVGNMESLAFLGVPSAATTSATWMWVLKVDSVGGHILPGSGNLPAVVWTGGRGWSDFSLAADAVNVAVFTSAGGTVYGSLVFNGEVELDPYKLSFSANGTQVIETENEDLDLAAYSKAFGDGTITFKRSVQGAAVGSNISTRTSFASGDTLHVACASLTIITSVRIPRYAT